MTNKHIGIITILLSLVVNITIVNADAKITNISINNSAISPMLTYYKKDGGKINFCGAATMDITYDNGIKITAYCIDPLTNAPAASATDITASEADSSYTYIWNKICGNKSACSDASKLATAARIYTAKSGQAINTYSNKKVGGMSYTSLYDAIKTSSEYTADNLAGMTYFGTPKNTKALLEIVESAKNSGASGTSKNQNTGLSISDSPNRTVAVSGNKAQTQFLKEYSDYCSCTDKGSDTSSCTCSLSTNYCRTNGADVTIKIPNESGNQSCTVTQFSSTSQDKTQRFIGCVPNGTAAENGEIVLTCDNQDEPDDCVIETGLHDEYCDTQCDPDCDDDECSYYDYDCEAIIEDLNDYDDNVAHICNADGELTIEYEAFYGSTVSDLLWDQVKCCLYKNGSYDDKSETATQKILQTTDSNELSFCPVSCTVKYSMNIPGPSSKGNKLVGNSGSVYINAGTFFEIDDSNLYSLENITCHMDLNSGYDNLLAYINRERESSVATFNEYAQLKAKANSKPSSYTKYDCNGIKTPQGNSTSLSGSICKGTDYYEPTTTSTENGTEYCCNGRCSSTYTRCPEPHQYNANETYGYKIESKQKENQYKYNSSKYLIESDGQYNYSENTMCASCNSESEAYQEATKKVKSFQDALNDQKDSLTKKMDANNNNVQNAINFYKNCTTKLSENIGKVKELYYNQYSFDFEYWDDSYYSSPELIPQNPEITTNETKEVGESEAPGANIKAYNNTCSVDKECDTKNPSEKVFDYKTAATELTIKTPYKFDNYYCVTNDGVKVELQSGKEEKDIGTECFVGSSSGIIQKGFPVSPEDTQGQYSYEYIYELPNGEFYSDICYYNVNSCKDCKTLCEGEYCTGKTECGTGCQTACVGSGCIFESSIGFMPTYKTISLNNTFALLEQSGNVLAIASSTKSTATNSGKFSNWTTEKGTKTKEKILKEGEGIYTNEPEYSIVLDASTINSIKEYNEQHSGSYSSLDPNTFQNVSKDGKITHTMYESKFVTQFLCDKGNSCDRKNKEINYTVYSGDWKGNEFVGPAWK